MLKRRLSLRRAFRLRLVLSDGVSSMVLSYSSLLLLSFLNIYLGRLLAPLPLPLLLRSLDLLSVQLRATLPFPLLGALRSRCSGLQARVWVFRSTVWNMRLALASPLVLWLSGCWALGGRMSSSPGDRPNAFTYPSQLRRPLSEYGQLPVVQVLRLLMQMEVVRSFPAGPLPPDRLAISETTRAIDAIHDIERLTAWVYDENELSFYLPQATHSVDQPDAFGRPQAVDRASLSIRPMVDLEFRFRRLDGGITANTLNAGVTLTEFESVVPEGVMSQFSNSQTRSYYNGVSSPVSGSATVVNTSLQSISAGLEVSAMAARLPGDGCRVDGKLEISSFTGATGTDKAEVEVPLQLDGLRGFWLTVYRVRGADASFVAATRGLPFLKPSATGDWIDLQIRVD